MHISATFKETGQPWRDYRLMDGPALSWEALEWQFSLYFFYFCTAVKKHHHVRHFLGEDQEGDQSVFQGRLVG